MAQKCKFENFSLCRESQIMCKRTGGESVKFALTVPQRANQRTKTNPQAETGSRFTGRPINESDKMANNTLENVQGMTIIAKQSTGRPGPQRLDSLVNPLKDLMFYLQDFKNHIL